MFGKKEKVLPLTEEEIERLQFKIESAENLSSAEFKIILVSSSWLGIRYTARKLFKKYGLQNTDLHNAVLILVDYSTRNMVLQGDSSVYQKMGEKFWRELNDMLDDALKGGSLFDALSACITILGHRLPVYYPHDENDINEISNELIFED